MRNQRLLLCAVGCALGASFMACGGATLGTLPDNPDAVADAAVSSDGSTSHDDQNLVGNESLFAGDCRKAPGTPSVLVAKTSSPGTGLAVEPYGILSDREGLFVLRSAGDGPTQGLEILSWRAGSIYPDTYERRLAWVPYVQGAPLVRTDSFIGNVRVASAYPEVYAWQTALPIQQGIFAVVGEGNTLYHATAASGPTPAKIERINPRDRSQKVATQWEDFVSLSTGLTPTAMAVDETNLYVAISVPSPRAMSPFLRINKSTKDVTTLNSEPLAESADPIQTGGMDQDIAVLYIAASRGDKTTTWGIASVQKMALEARTNYFPTAENSSKVGSISVVHIDSASIYYLVLAPPTPGSIRTHSIRRMCRDGSNDIEVASATGTMPMVDFAIDGTKVFYSSEGALYSVSK